LTPDFGKLSISPESSDGFASVGTILPKEEVTLLPGGLFAFRGNIDGRKRCTDHTARRKSMFCRLRITSNAWRCIGAVLSVEQTCFVGTGFGERRYEPLE
jgi:hypothetical protein